VSFGVVWHPPATRDLLDIKWQDAAWIVREVNKLAEDGVGDVRSELLPTVETATAASGPSRGETFVVTRAR
jgi:hypothetical protein